MRGDKMKSSIGSFLISTVQREANLANTEQLKLLSDFHVPMHRYNKLASDEEKTGFLLEHMASYMKNLVKQLGDLQEAKRSNDKLRVDEINKRFMNDCGLYAWL